MKSTAAIKNEKGCTKHRLLRTVCRVLSAVSRECRDCPRTRSRHHQASSGVLDGACRRTSRSVRQKGEASRQHCRTGRTVLRGAARTVQLTLPRHTCRPRAGRQTPACPTGSCRDPGSLWTTSSGLLDTMMAGDDRWPAVSQNRRPSVSRHRSTGRCRKVPRGCLKSGNQC